MLWINSQLKKKPGARLVEDLRNDTRDGVAFIDLISVIGTESVKNQGYVFIGHWVKTSARRPFRERNV